MSFENKEQSINPETLSKLKEAQEKRDLDTVTKIFLSLTPKDRNEFVNEYAKKDPVYAQIISEITPYIQSQANNLMQEYS
jgi:TRAP-type mannitol/chloroaromatic compound transport system substrate-binding protein